MLPVHPKLLAPLIDALARLPEDRVFPWRGRRHPPGAVGAPVVGEIHGEHGVALVEGLRSQRIGIIPAVPELAGPELRRLPAQVRLLRLADPVSRVPEE